MQLIRQCVGIVAKELTTFDRTDWVIVGVVAAVTLALWVLKDIIQL